MREAIRGLTLLQRRAIQRRLLRHLHGSPDGNPVRATTIGNRHAPVAEVYSPGAYGWTARAMRPLRIRSRNEVALECPPNIKALIGTVLSDGQVFSPGTPEDIEPLLADETDLVDETE